MAGKKTHAVIKLGSIPERQQRGRVDRSVIFTFSYNLNLRQNRRRTDRQHGDDEKNVDEVFHD